MKPATPAHRYTLIRFRYDLRIPGIPLDRSHLVEVDATPHVGGLDVVFGDNIVTIPWFNIASAVRKAPANA